jgi:hypothetical protein
VSLSAGSQKPSSPTWSSNDDWLEVPPIRPSPVVTANVEEVPVSLAQPESDTSSGVGRAGMLEPWVVRSESSTPGSSMAWVESRAPRGAQPKS